MKDRFQPGDRIKARGIAAVYEWTVLALITPKNSMSEYESYYAISREDSKQGEIKRVLLVSAAENYDVLQ